MSDRFAPQHCPSTGLLRRSQARTGLSKACTSTQSLPILSFIILYDFIMPNRKISKTSEKRHNKGHHIDVRFTEEEYKQIVANAAKCGMPKSLYVHNTVLGHQPKQLMTEEQEEALKSLSAARSELVGIRNALHGLPQEVRKRYFKNERFMEAWIEGINYLIRQWDTIREKFMG